MKRFYKIPELADLLQISRSKAYTLIKEEGITPLHIGPRSNRISKEQVDSLLEKWKQGVD